MKRIIGIILVTILLTACSSKKERSMVVEGNIKGLKKGVLYLQKMKDTVLVSIDSAKVIGDGNFKLTDDVDFPVMYYITFKGNTTDKRILFFGNKGTITVNDNIETFGFNPEIIGSENQLVLNDFAKINNQFKNQSLEFIKKEFEAKSANDKELLAKVQEDYNRMVRRKYLYTTNFALTHPSSEAAPYIALTELYNANIKLLDTINKTLTPKIKASDYGKRLDNFIKRLKETEEK